MVDVAAVADDASGVSETSETLASVTFHLCQNFEFEFSSCVAHDDEMSCCHVNVIVGRVAPDFTSFHVANSSSHWHLQLNAVVHLN